MTASAQLVLDLGGGPLVVEDVGQVRAVVRCEEHPYVSACGHCVHGRHGRCAHNDDGLSPGGVVLSCCRWRWRCVCWLAGHPEAAGS